jgi:hypothetical protein
MLKLKCTYYLKLILITALTTIFFSSVEKAPEQPLLFLATTFVLCVCIHLLWISSLWDEKEKFSSPAARCTSPYPQHKSCSIKEDCIMAELMKSVNLITTDQVDCITWALERKYVNLYSGQQLRDRITACQEFKKELTRLFGS